VRLSRRLAADSYKHFADCEGNQHIASEFALEHLLDVIKRSNARSILEIGLGIGSISYTVLSANQQRARRQPIAYCGTEANAFCLHQLRRNLGPVLFSEIEIFASLDAVPAERRFDVIVIDGSDPGLARVARLTTARGVLLVEGDRADQLAILRGSFGGSLVYRAISSRRNPAYGPHPRERWAGGCHVIFARPSLRQRIDWMRNGVVTSIRYRLRRWNASS
jgi:hypothetical protein